MAFQFNLTPAAILFIKTKLSERGTPQAALRLGVKGGQCSGYAYVIQYEDEAPRNKDLIFDYDGLRVFIDSKSILILNGSTLDYEKTMMKSGLKFINPNQKSNCGCGESFSL